MTDLGFSSTSIRTFWTRFLTNLQSTYVKLAQVDSSNLVVKGLGEGINALYKAAHAFPEAHSSSTDVNQNWIDFAVRELAGFNGHGPGAVASLSEAVIKTQAITNAWQQNPEERSPIFFRGQTDFDWTVEPRIFRTMGYRHEDGNLKRTTQQEIEALRVFQSHVIDNPDFRSELSFGGVLPSDNSPEWWELMQHYDEAGGTRMVDITSSIFCGLFFACANWDGSVDRDTHGSLHFLPATPGRPETISPDRNKRGDLWDAVDQAQSSAEAYFDIEAADDTIRFRRSRGTNPRLMAQDGYFLWQPKFADALELHQHFKFRVPGSQKEHILRELYSFGYTAERIVRGPAGRAAHEELVRLLGIPTCT